MNQFHGKYRGKVLKNQDPLSLGRLQVSVPAVLGEGSLSWAMPCVPYAGKDVGFFMLPSEGSNVWVEFEGGILIILFGAVASGGGTKCPLSLPRRI